MVEPHLQTIEAEIADMRLFTIKPPDIATSSIATPVRIDAILDVMRKRFSDLSADPAALDPSQFLKDINSLGKGRFAQRLASILLTGGNDVCPPYIEAALDYVGNSTVAANRLMLRHQI